jgi:type I restriction enzyme S subunit
MSLKFPEGWREISLAQHVDLLPGFAFKSETFSNDPNGRLPLIRIRDLRDQRPDIFVPIDFDNRFLVRNGDFLVGMDGEFSSLEWR